MLVAVLIVLVAASIATNRLPTRWYVPTCVVATGCLLVLARLDGLDAADLGLGPGTVLPGLIWAVVLVLAVALLYLGGATLPRTRNLFADRRFMGTGGQQVAYYLSVRIPFGTVLLEEIAFRSVLFAMVTIRHGTWWAVAVTSVLFGLWHVLPAIPMHQSHDAVHGALGTGARGRIAVVATVVATAVGESASPFSGSGRTACCRRSVCIGRSTAWASPSHGGSAASPTVGEAGNHGFHRREMRAGECREPWDVAMDLVFSSGRGPEEVERGQAEPGARCGSDLR